MKSEDQENGPDFKSPININHLHLLNNKKGIHCPKCPAHFFFKEYFEQHLQNDHSMCTVSEIQKVITETLSSEDAIPTYIKVENNHAIPETSAKIFCIGFDDNCLLYTSPSPRD